MGLHPAGAGLEGPSESSWGSVGSRTVPVIAMRIRLRRGRDAGRCAFCHGDLEPDQLACSSCHSAYHVECATSCVTLGCTGQLVTKHRPLEDHPASGAFIVLTLALPILGAIAIAAPNIFTIVAATTSCALWFFAFVVLLYPRNVGQRISTRRGTTSVAPRPVSPQQVPAEPGIPSLFAARPIEVDGGSASADDLARRQHQKDALGDRRPPGLGRTI